MIEHQGIISKTVFCTTVFSDKEGTHCRQYNRGDPEGCNLNCTAISGLNHNGILPCLREGNSFCLFLKERNARIKIRLV